MAGFNEAAGIPRGRQDALGGPSIRWRSFNEAAGIPRGRQPRALTRIGETHNASMRPRVFPAEDRDFAIRLNPVRASLQ